jgi:hypothetical protein
MIILLSFREISVRWGHTQIQTPLQFDILTLLVQTTRHTKERLTICHAFVNMIKHQGHMPLRIGKRQTCHAEQQALDSNILMEIQYMELITCMHAHQSVQMIHSFLYQLTGHGNSPKAKAFPQRGYSEQGQ